MGRVIFLGTGDPLNEERAQTCLAVPLAEGETMLFDASSGTVLLSQLQAAGIALTSVRHLFVTHRHFDHVGGLAPLLTALTALPEASLTVHAPPRMLPDLHDLLALTIPGVEDWLGERLRWAELKIGKPTTAEEAEVTPFEVDHGIECVGFRVEQGGSAMVYAADGAIVATPTTSLPEQPSGGARNWDYRYTWIRDAAFSLYALLRLGFTEEADAFMSWLTERFRDPRPKEKGPLQIMYGIDGRAELPEEVLGHLEGYRGWGPMRVGNGVYDQLQLDIYGELIDSVYLYKKYGTPI